MIMIDCWATATAYSLQPTTAYSLQQPTAYSLQPTAYSLQPTQPSQPSQLYSSTALQLYSTTALQLYSSTALQLPISPALQLYSSTALKPSSSPALEEYHSSPGLLVSSSFQISVFPNFKHLANTLEILKNALGTILRIPTVRRQLAVREGKLPSRRANCLKRREIQPIWKL
jgi:hypothetical protein